MSDKKRRILMLKTMVSAEKARELQAQHSPLLTDTVRKFNMINSLSKSAVKTPTVAQSMILGKKEEKSFPAKTREPTEPDEPNEEPVFSEVSGPQLRINKNYLAFVEKTGNLAKDNIQVTNNGSTAIYYRWKKLDKDTFFKKTLLDKEERFFCHAGKNVIKPGQTKTFYFTFKSRVTGIFEEEWALECEPPLLTPLPPIKLSGHAIEDDPNVEWRSELDLVMEKKHKNRFITEIINDVIGEVRTPTPPLPDLNNPEVCKREFEEKNAKYNVYYTPVVMNLYRHFQSLIYEELHLKHEENYWDLNVDFLLELINRVRENSVRENFLRRFHELMVLAKKKPYDRSSAYSYIRSTLEGMMKEFPAAVNNVRRDKDIMEINFSEPVDLTPEEQKKKQDEEAKAKAEFLKKQKKKPKNEEEEKKIMEEYRTQLTLQITQMISQQVQLFHDNEPIIRSTYEIKTRKRPTEDYFEMLGTKKTMKDLDLEEKRILLRIHLKLKEKKPEPIPVEEPEPVVEPEKPTKGKTDAKANDSKAKEKAVPPPVVKEEPKVVKPVGKDRKSKKDEQAEELARQKEEAKKQFIESIDEKSLAEAVSSIKMCLEQLAKLVIVLVSYGEPNGRPDPKTSIKYFWEYMVDLLDQDCVFEEACKIDDLQERIDAERYINNSAVILENIFHEPEEVGYVFDEERKLNKLDHWQIQEFANRLVTYAPVYIIDDRDNIFKDYTSLTKVQTEMTIFGPILSNDLVVVPQAFLHCAFEPKKSQSKRKKNLEEELPKKISIAVLGGEFSADAIMALDTILGFYDEIFIMGKIAVMFLLAKLGLKSFGPFTLNHFQQTLIEKFLANAKELNKQIRFPEKLIIAPKPEAKEDTPEWVTAINETKFLWPDGYEQYLKELAERAPPVEEQPQKKDDKQKKGDTQKKDKDPKDSKDPKKNQTLQEIPHEDPDAASKGPGEFLIIGFEESFVQQIGEKLPEMKNILWIGSLEPMEHPALNDNNRALALKIYEVKDERKPKPVPNGIPADWLVTFVGEDLQKGINSFDIISEPAPAVPSKKEEDGLEEEVQEEEEKSMQDEGFGSKADVESVSKENQAEKRNNIGLLADAFSANTPFVLKLIAGAHLETLNLITNYEKKNEEEEDQDFSFIDEI